MTTTTDHPGHRSPRRSARRRWQAGLAASVLALSPLALAACGGSEDSASASAGDTGQATAAPDMEAFQECLAENGVEMGGRPSEDGSSDDSQQSMPDQDAMAQAQEACADLMPEGMGQGGPGMGQGGGGEDMQAYTECLTENGVEVTMPGGDGGEPPSGEPPSGDAEAGEPPSGGSMFGLDESDPEVAAAMEACADLEPEMPSGGPGGTTDGSGTDDSSTDDSSGTESS